MLMLIMLSGCSGTVAPTDDEQSNMLHDVQYVDVGDRDNYCSSPDEQVNLTAMEATFAEGNEAEIHTEAYYEAYYMEYGIGGPLWECSRHVWSFHDIGIFTGAGGGGWSAIVDAEAAHAWSVQQHELELVTGQCHHNINAFIQHFGISREAFQELIDGNIWWYFQYGGDTLDILYSGDLTLIDHFFSWEGSAYWEALAREDRYYAAHIKKLQQIVNENTSEMSWYFHDIWTHSHFTIGKGTTSWWMQSLIDAGEYDRVNIVEFLIFWNLLRQSSITPNITAFESIVNMHNMNIFTHHNFEILLSGDWDLIREYYSIANEPYHTAQVQARFNAYVAAHGYVPDTSWMIDRSRPSTPSQPDNQPSTPSQPSDPDSSTGTSSQPSQPGRLPGTTQRPTQDTSALTIPVNNNALQVYVQLNGQDAILQLPASTVTQIIDTSVFDTAIFDLTALPFVTVATLPVASFSAMGSAGNYVEFQFPYATLRLDSVAIDSIQQQANGEYVSIIVETYHQILSPTLSLIHVALRSNSQQITEVAGAVTVEIQNVDLPSASVWHVGNISDTLLSSYFVEETKTMSFTITQTGVFMFGYDPMHNVSLPPAPPPTAILRLTMGSMVFTHLGMQRHSDVAPFIDTAYDRAMIPLRIVAEGLGAEVSFDGDTRTVHIIQDAIEITLVIDVPLPDYMGTPVIVYDRTFVPARYVSEILGATVRWDGVNQAVYVYR